MHKDSTTYVGLDVHKDSITVACVGAANTDPVIDVGTIGTQQYAIDRLIKKLGSQGRLQWVYEAGPCGFWLQRYLAGKRQPCVVAAPSLIPKRPGDRIKTDRRDARNLALALRAGTLTPVHIPTPAQESFRDVVRAWQQAKRDITAARQRLKSFLLRNDIRYTGRASWNEAHRRWLSELVLPATAQQIVCQELIDAISTNTALEPGTERCATKRGNALAPSCDDARSPAAIDWIAVPLHPQRHMLLVVCPSPQPVTNWIHRHLRC